MEFAQDSGLSGTPSRPSGGVGAQEVVKKAQAELCHLLQERAEVVRRIGRVKQTIAGLAHLFGDEVLPAELCALLNRRSRGRKPGLTQACRTVLIEAVGGLDRRQVSERIQLQFPNTLSRHKDPLASVTTVLNRLADSGEAQSVIGEEGRRKWQWSTAED